MAELESTEGKRPARGISRRSIVGAGVFAVKLAILAELGVPLAAFGVDRWRRSHPTNTVEAGQGRSLQVQGNAGWARRAEVQFGVSMVNSNDPANPYFVPKGEPQQMRVIRVNPIYGDTLPNGKAVRMDTYDVLVTPTQFAALSANPTLLPLTSSTEGTPFQVTGRQQTAQYTYRGEGGQLLTVFSTQSLLLDRAQPYTPQIKQQ